MICKINFKKKIPARCRDGQPVIGRFWMKIYLHQFSLKGIRRLWCWMTLVRTLETLESIWGTPFCNAGVDGAVRSTDLCWFWDLWGKASILDFWNWEEPQESFTGIGLSLLRKPSRDLPLHTIKSRQSQFL